MFADPVAATLSVRAAASRVRGKLLRSCSHEKSMVPVPAGAARGNSKARLYLLPASQDVQGGQCCPCSSILFAPSQLSRATTSLTTWITYRDTAHVCHVLVIVCDRHHKGIVFVLLTVVSPLLKMAPGIGSAPSKCSLNKPILQEGGQVGNV